LTTTTASAKLQSFKFFFFRCAVVIEKHTPSIFSKIATRSSPPPPAPPQTTMITTTTIRQQHQLTFKISHFFSIVLVSFKNLHHQYFLK
jgi:hypothetical protein